MGLHMLCFPPPLHAGEFNASRYAALIRQVCYGRKKEQNANGLALDGAAAAIPHLADHIWTETMKTGSVRPSLVLRA